ncbi:MAG: RNA polymerase sigma factor [Clostridia bacterium]|nr:RNA polymerase sigma factor [Clostridia bacterium]
MDPIETAVQGIKKGNYQLYETIIQNFQQPLFRYCCHMLGNTYEAEDALQDVFIKAYEKMDSYSESISFSAWLYKMTYHHCVNLLRRKKLIQFLPFLDDTKMIENSFEKKLEDRELSEPLNMGLKRLSMQERSILILKILEEKSYEELSTILNVKSATIRKKYERARKKLRHYLQNEKGGMENEGYAVNR